LKYVQLGGRRASAIGLGTRQLGAVSYGWGRDYGEKEARQMVRRALELGINLFDTAEWYAGGHSERVLSDALGDRRDEALIASKVSPHHLTRLGVKRAANRSLQRLGVSAIDLYQIHWPNPLIPLSWTMRGMKELMEEGLVRQVGVSNFSLWRWQRAEKLLGTAVTTNQVEFHLLKTKPADDLVPYARRQGRAIIAYSPLAQGALTAAYAIGSRPRGVRSRNALFSVQNQQRRGPFIEELCSVARAHGVTPAQIALAWLIHDPNVIAIPGAKSVEQVESNAAAADITLSDAECQHLRTAALGPYGMEMEGIVSREESLRT